LPSLSHHVVTHERSIFIWDMKHSLRQQRTCVGAVFLLLCGQQGKSTLAHGCRCTHYQKIYFKIFENFEKKNFDIHLDILCSFTKFREKKHFFVASVKRQISML
jgi:hypothetical protein